MNIKICTPVIGETLDQLLDNLEKIQKISKFVEIRADYISNITEEDVDAIKKNTRVDSIFTCRKKAEGGTFQGSEDARRAILKKAIDAQYDYVDIELSTMKQSELLKKGNTKIIISYHNFEKTPSYWDMQSIIHDMNSFKPAVLKITTMMQEEYEATKLYRLLTNKPHNEERIVIGMGEKGRMTRILGPLLGSFLTFASTEYGGSAPGQIELSELQEIYESFESP